MLLEYHKCFHAQASTHEKYGRRMKVHIVRLTRVMVLMIKQMRGKEPTAADLSTSDVLTLLQSSLSSWDVASCDGSSSGRTRLQFPHNKSKLCS